MFLVELSAWYAATGQARQQMIWLDNYPVALIQTPTTGVPELAWCLIWRYASYVLVSSRVFLKDYIQEWKGEE